MFLLGRAGIIEPDLVYAGANALRNSGSPGNRLSRRDQRNNTAALARKYHPDVNPEQAGSAAVLSDIAEAYRVLNDTEARRAYDAERALRQRQANTKPTGPLNHSCRRRVQGTKTPLPQPVTTTTQESERLVAASADQPSRGDASPKPRSLAEQSLALQPEERSGLGKILGRCLPKPGPLPTMPCATTRWRASTIPEARLCNKRSSGSPVSPRAMAIAARPWLHTCDAPPHVAQALPAPQPLALVHTHRAYQSTNLTDDKRPLLRLLAGFFGFFGAFLLLLLAGIYLGKTPAETQVLPFVSSWSWPFVACLATAGALIGSAMTITGTIRRIEDDLILTGSTGPRTAPLGMFIIVLGLIFFWAAAILHLAIALIQESLTASLLKLYGTIAFTTALFAVCWTTSTNGGGGQTLLLGGNIIFIGFIVGWLLGDFFRTD